MTRRDNMHRRFTLLASLLVAAAAAASEETGAGGGLRAAAHEESVSSEPLTFEYMEPEPVDRDRLLAEAPDADEEEEGADNDGADEAPEDGGWEYFEGLDLLDLEDADETEGEDYGLLDDAAMPDYVDADFDAEEDGDFAPMDGDLGFDDGMDYDHGMGYDDAYVAEEWEPIEGAEFGDEGDAPEPDYDSTYDAPDGEDFYEEVYDDEEEGHEEVGEPMEAYEPISRRLRRLDNPVMIEEGTEEGERYLEEKMSFQDDSSPIFDPQLDENGEFDLTPYAEPSYLEELAASEGEFDQHNRDLSGCRANQKRLKIQIVTDNSGWENRWVVRNARGALVAKGPPGSTKYASNKQYVGGLCLNAGTYSFTMFDSFNDGMCGTRTGKGLYRVFVGGAKRFTSPANCAMNWGKRTHTFRIQGSSGGGNTPSRPVSRPTVNNNAISGRGGCSNVRIQFKIDKFGRETSVTLTGNGRTHLSSIKNVGAYQTKTLTKCVPPGTYTLRLQDQDGLCCNNGKGWYKMTVNGVNVASGGYFVRSKSHTVQVGSNWRSQMSSRDTEWLNAHNARRRKYNGGKGYVPMRWSRSLAADARAYAAQLGRNCANLVHARGIQYGENLAKNSGSGSWGQRYPADKILRRWVEQELTWPYPRNAHYTQVVWRASQYVGCGEYSKSQGGNKMCRIQVCRYARPGNCNVRNGNWRAEAWKDDTNCGQACPRGVCFV